MFGGKIDKMEDEEALWEIEEILEKKYDPIDRRHKYKIKWKGYSLKEATWEPIENLMSVQYMVEEFEDQLRKKNPVKSKKIGAKGEEGFSSPQELPSREVKAVSNNNEGNTVNLNNTKVGSSMFGAQNKSEGPFENMIEFDQDYAVQGNKAPDSQIRPNKAVNEIVIDDDDDKPVHTPSNNPTVSSSKGFVNGDQHAAQRISRFSDSQDVNKTSQYDKRLPPNQYQARSDKLFQHAFGQPAPPVQVNNQVSFIKNEGREKDRFSDKERERDQAKDLYSFGKERGSLKEEDRIHNRNRDKDGEASRERSVDNSRLKPVKEEVAGGNKSHSGLGSDAGSIKTENKDGSSVVRTDKPLEKKRTVLKKTLHAKFPLKKRVNLNVKGHYEAIVNGYVSKELDRKTFLELLCPEGNFKDDEIQQIKCISWDGKATMDPEDYYFKIIWKQRADGVQKAARYASWQEILEESPEEAADFIFEKLITIISKYGTFGEF